VSSESLHERLETLTTETVDFHRAIVSLMEELEAIDWYQQRIDATGDAELKAVLGHNRDEEIEHAMMNLEWIRRRNAKVNEAARTYLFTDRPITELEIEAENAESGTIPDAPADPSSLGIGSLRQLDAPTSHMNRRSREV
jgi:ferritin-like protein